MICAAWSYAEEQEVIDALSSPQLSAIVWHVSSSNVLVASEATGVVMSEIYGPHAPCQASIMSSTELSYELPRVHCLNSPLHLHRSFGQLPEQWQEIALTLCRHSEAPGCRSSRWFSILKDYCTFEQLNRPYRSSGILSYDPRRWVG